MLTKAVMQDSGPFLTLFYLFLSHAELWRERERADFIIISYIAKNKLNNIINMLSKQLSGV